MTIRIENLAQTVLKKTIYPEPKEIEYDKFDLLLPENVIERTKIVC